MVRLLNAITANLAGRAGAAALEVRVRKTYQRLAPKKTEIAVSGSFPWSGALFAGPGPRGRTVGQLMVAIRASICVCSSAQAWLTSSETSEFSIC
jgi:hypothetical protein